MVGFLISIKKFLEYFSMPVFKRVSQGGDTLNFWLLEIFQCSVAYVPGCLGEWYCTKHQEQRPIFI